LPTTSRLRRLFVATIALLGLALPACGGAPAEVAASPKSPSGHTATSASQPGYGYPASEAPAADFAGEGGDFGPQAAPPAPVGASKSAPMDARARRESEVAPEPTTRPGLGTEWGETRSSRITTVPFSRADSSTPFVTSALFYNDEEGARAMANAAGFQRMTSGQFRVGNGVVTIGLKDENGSFFPGFIAGGKSNVIGEASRRYTIVVRNLTPARFEVVLSVDGLDVLDGKPASFSKRGYLIDPNGELEVDGFRQSTDAVAAFRFGSVRDSYANQKGGETRNVGVIGLALFHERGTNPFPWTDDEVRRRQEANPFPGQFATPPGQ
jgi:hypothetical protein